MADRRVEVDERTKSVQYEAGYRAYIVMGYLLVLDLGVRAVRPEWTTWNGFPLDVFLILVSGGLTQLLWARRHQVIGPKYARVLTLSAALALVLGVLIVLAIS